MPTRTSVLKTFLLVSMLNLPVAASAVSFDVPGTHPTLQAAIAAAAFSVDLDNTITISVSPVVTGSVISIGAAFGPARHLLIRPAAPLVRASVVSTNPSVAIFDLAVAGNVVIQDLDILRNVTNNYHLVVLSTCENVTIERCRIGSNWTTPGSNGWSNIELTYPTEVILRNNIFFAYFRGTFDRGIHAFAFNDPANSLRLYNNVVADYDLFGIHLEGVIAGPLMVLKNNIAVNHTGFLVEPIGYRSDAVIGGPTVVTSHNTAFAALGNVQAVAGGCQDIAGLGPTFIRWNRVDVLGAFLTRDWATAPPWDFNPNFYRLLPGGRLHFDAAQYGTTVTNVFPDVAVVDDIDLQVRPSGAGPHTDRGVDQIEKSATAAAGDLPHGATLLQAFARQRSPRAVIVDYRAASAGLLTLQVFDVAGRRIEQVSRRIEAGSGSIETPLEAAHGMVLYRVNLDVENGRGATISGKVLVGR